MRKFATGATRDTDSGKLDFEGFLSPFAIERFAEYMNKNRRQADGAIRASDNWQKGIPLEAYMKSWHRHFHAAWKAWRLYQAGLLTFEQFAAKIEDDLCAAAFNNNGFLHEIVIARQAAALGGLVRPADAVQPKQSRLRRKSPARPPERRRR